MNFIRFVVLPFWKLLNKFYNNELTEGVFNLENNMEEWGKMRTKELEKQEKEKLKEKGRLQHSGKSKSVPKLIKSEN